MIDKRIHKVFAYEQDMNLALDKYNDGIITNVPCYAAKDLDKLLWCFGIDFMFEYDIHYKIQTNNHRGATHYYVPAQTKLREWLNKEVVFALLRGDIDKAPKIYIKKYLHVIGRGSYTNEDGIVFDTADAYIIQKNDLWHYKMENA